MLIAPLEDEVELRLPEMRHTQAFHELVRENLERLYLGCQCGWLISGAPLERWPAASPPRRTTGLEETVEQPNCHFRMCLLMELVRLR